MEWETAAPRADGVDHTVSRGGSAPGRSQRGPGRSQRGRTRSQQGRMMSRAASTFALVVSGSVLLGWQLELPILRTILPGRAAMSPLTSVTFVLVATALWLGTEWSGGHRPIRWLAQAAAGIVLLVRVVPVFGYDLGENLSMNQSRFLDRLGTDGIEPHTGLCFVLLSAALLLLDSESRPRVWPAPRRRRRSRAERSAKSPLI